MNDRAKKDGVATAGGLLPQGEAEAAAREALEQAHATGRPIDARQSRPPIWAIALDQLVQANRIDVVSTSLPRLLEVFPRVVFLQTLKEVLAQLPPESGVPFADDRARFVQVVPSPGAQTVVFAFTGRAQRLFLELNLVHRWIAGLGVHVVYLREPKPTLFMRGVPTLSTDYAGTVHALKRIAADLGATRTCCLGTCLGGYAALRYGIDLGAERVLAYSPQTFIGPNAGDRARPDPNGELPAAGDLKKMLLAAGHRPSIRLVYGNASPPDVEHANHLAGVPDVIHEPLPDISGHNSLSASISARRFVAQLGWLVERPASA